VLAELDGSKAKKELDTNGVLTIMLEDGEIKLTEEELLIEAAQAKGYESLSDRGVTVAINTTLTDELIEEGFVREIISKIQSMRKEADFDVSDHIVLYQNGNDKLAEIIRRNQNDIKHDVLADKIKFGELDGFTMEWNVNGENCSFGVKVIK